MENFIQFVVAHQTALAAAGVFIIQEIIAFAPGIQSNSILQLVFAGLKKLAGAGSSSPN